jgi:hypothetical protein
MPESGSWQKKSASLVMDVPKNTKKVPAWQKSASLAMDVPKNTKKKCQPGKKVPAWQKSASLVMDVPKSTYCSRLFLPIFLNFSLARIGILAAVHTCPQLSFRRCPCKE